MSNIDIKVHIWTSLVAGDRQLDRPKSQTYMECFHVHVLLNYWGF